MTEFSRNVWARTCAMHEDNRATEVEINPKEALSALLGPTVSAYSGGPGDRTEPYVRSKVGWPSRGCSPVDATTNLPADLRRFVDGSDASWLMNDTELKSSLGGDREGQHPWRPRAR